MLSIKIIKISHYIVIKGWLRHLITIKKEKQLPAEMPLHHDAKDLIVRCTLPHTAHVEKRSEIYTCKQ